MPPDLRRKAVLEDFRRGSNNSRRRPERAVPTCALPQGLAGGDVSVPAASFLCLCFFFVVSFCEGVDASLGLVPLVAAGDSVAGDFVAAR